MPKSIDSFIGQVAPAVILACLMATTTDARAQSTEAVAQPLDNATPEAGAASETPPPEAAAPEGVASSEAPAPEANSTADAQPVEAAPEAAPADGQSTPVSMSEATETIAVEPVQKPASAEAPAKPASDTVQLDDVVVTATKRQKSLREIPASIASFSGEKLEEQGKLGLSDYLQQTPGVTMTSAAPNFPRISMRGISTDTNGLSPIPSPTGIFIGDTAFSDPYISNIQPDLSAFDLASVDVLKGPQGTLFGGEALAGAIRYVLQDPTMGEWQARGFSQYTDPTGGSTALTNGIAVNVPLYSDRLALRAVYIKRRYPGVTDLPDKNPPQFDVDDGKGDQIRAILAWQPIDELKFKLTHMTQDYSAANATSTADTPDARERTRQVLPSPVNSKFQLDSAEINLDLDGVRLVSLTSYTTKNAYVVADATAAIAGRPPSGYPPALGAFESFLDDSKAFAQELRIQSNGDGPFQWLAGAYLYNYKVKFELIADLVAHQTLLGHGSLVDALLSGISIDPSTLYDKTTLLYALSQPKAQERALFFDLSDKFFDHLELSAGARVYSTKIKGGFFGTGVLALAENGGQDINYTSNSIKENGVSPKATATWRFNRDYSLYAQAARGFRFGGLQSVPSTPTNHVPAVYKSDSLWNYETGLRTAWLENTLHADLTVFYIDYKNPQLVQTTGTIPLNYTDNVGAAISQGLEASLHWLTPVPGLALSLDGGLVDAHTTKPFIASTGDEVPVGTPMPGASKSQVSGTIAYLFPVGPLNVGTTVNYLYIGKGFSDLTSHIAINDVGTLNTGLTFGTDAWSFKPQLAFNVSNVLNTTAVVAGGTGSPIVGADSTSYMLNAPRTYSIRLSLAY